MRILTGELFKTLLKSAAANLSNNQKRIDTLNVFPVPDGDTGTNMSMTFTSGTNDALVNPSNELNEIARSLSKGLLMGARGNSGVITSQIFRGFYQSLENNKSATVNEVALAFINGSKVAYKAIMKPVEGTILTVIREGSENALLAIEEKNEATLLDYFTALKQSMEISLENTPNLLPILKEVGVVDSGGSGILSIIEGMVLALEGKICELDATVSEGNDSAALEIENDEFGYCTEFIISLNEIWLEKFKEEKLKKSLSEIGDSLVVVKDEELVKVHVHTLKPGDALNIGQRYGEFIKLKIENMQQQHENIKNNNSHGSMLEAHINSKKTKYAVIAVAAGDGLQKLFKEYRTDIVISGGQTMNPSTEDFVSAIKKVNSEHIFILPNNSNIILAANQAKEVMEELDIHVLETKSIQEGLAALTSFNPEADVEENISEMEETFKNIHTASLTYAVKDTSFEGIDVKVGDYIGMHNKKIIVSNKDRFEVIKTIIDTLSKYEDKELLTIYVGEDGDGQEVDKLCEYISETTSFEYEIVESNQPVYNYLFGLE